MDRFHIPDEVLEAHMLPGDSSDNESGDSLIGTYTMISIAVDYLIGRIFRLVLSSQSESTTK